MTLDELYDIAAAVAHRSDGHYDVLIIQSHKDVKSFPVFINRLRALTDEV